MNSKIRVVDTIFKDAKEILPSIFEDHRGFYVETYNKEEYRKAGIDLEFVQDDVSVSRKNVLRGIHGDSITWKLVQCLHGVIWNVIVDLNTSSPTFEKWQAFRLSAYARNQLLIPPGFGNGIVSLADYAVYHYKQTTYYDRSKQFTIKWDNPVLNIQWPIQDPILSKRDAFED